MTTPELIAYIQKRIAAGIPTETIEKALLSNGWSRTDIAQAFAQISAPSRAAVLPAPTSYAAPATRPVGKIALSGMLVLVSLVYAFYQYIKNPQLAGTSATSISTTAPTNNTSVTSTPVAVAPAAKPSQPVSSTPVSTPTPVTTPAVVPVTKPAGRYTDGTYTGAAENAYYGTLQVAAVVKNGALADVQFLQYANDRSTSRYINGQAMPQLKQEAITAQSANVDIVSGATFTSEAFQKSLGSALAQATN